MTISASVMRSPSSVTRKRKTPCVDGCCGPMLTTSGSVLTATELSSPQVRVLIGETPETRPESAGQSHKVLAQRMSREAFPKHDPLEIRVTSEVDAHEVVRLALLQVR